MCDSNDLERFVVKLMVDDQERKAVHEVASRTVEVRPPPAWALANADDRAIQFTKERRAGSLAPR